MKRYFGKKSYKKIGSIIAAFLVLAIFLNNESIYSVLAAESAPKAAADNSGSQGAEGENAPPEGGNGSESQPPEGGNGNESQPPEGGDGNESQPPEGGDGNESQPPEGGNGNESQPPEGGNGNESQPPEGGNGNESQPPEGGNGSESQPPEGGDGNESQPPEEGDGTGDKLPADGVLPEKPLPEELPTDGSLDGEVIDDADGEEGIPSCVEEREHEYEVILGEDGSVTGYRCVFCLREISEETLEAEGASLHAHIWNRAEGEIIPVCEDCGLARLDCDGEDGYGIHIFELIQEEGKPDKYRCVICGEEKEFLDEWDMTAELFAELMGVSLYADITLEYNGETSQLPTTLDELASYSSNGNKEFLVKNLADLMALQELGKVFNFDGYTVAFVFRQMSDGTMGPDDGKEWDLTELKDDFKGLGTVDYPFKGTLTLSYDARSFHFRTTTPLLHYVAAGAEVSKFQINADITGDGSGPIGAIASYVVSDEGGTVTVSDISLSGSISNPGGAAGGFFGEVVSTSAQESIKIDYKKGDGSELGISVGIDVSGGSAGGLAGRTEGKVEVYKTDAFPTGAVSGTQYAGMLVGSMEEGGTLFAAGSDGSAGSDREWNVNVMGTGTSGGLAGRIEKGTLCRTEGNEEELILTGKVEGGHAGGLVGECTDTEVKMDHVAVKADVTALAGNAGGVIGVFTESASGTGNANAPDEDWHLLHHIDISGKIRGVTNIGGIVGDLKGSNVRIGLPGEADNFECMKVSGNISADSQGAAAGGMIGTAEGEYIEVYHVTITGGIDTAGTIGGVVGKVRNAVVKVRNAKVGATLDPQADGQIQGGIFGDILPGSMAALDGEIDVEGLKINNASLLRGYIAGKQEEALVYFEENCRYQKPEGKNWVDNIGNYGGVYRNGTWGEGGNTPLISYAGKNVTGEVGNSGSRWVLDSEADIMRLAIMLNTEGRFSRNCFGGTTKADLLKADYLLNQSSYALGESGIYALNRNDKGNAAEERFAGKLIGQGKTEIDLGECITYQSYLSLFPCAGEGVEFRNLTVKRNIRYARDAAAGLAVYTSGNVTADGVDMQVSLTGSAVDSPYLYGGMFADYRAKGAVTLSVTNSRIGGSFEISQNTGDDSKKQYLGGLLAKYTADTAETPSIQIDGLEIAASITSSSGSVSGMITQINTEDANKDKDRDRVTLDMRKITVTGGTKISISHRGESGGFLGWKWFGIGPYAGNYSINELTVGDGGTAASGPSYYTDGGYGGLVHTVTGRIQLKDVHIRNASFCARPGISNHNGLLFHNGHNALIELEGYEIADQGVGVKPADINCAANREKVSVTGETAYFGEVVGSNMGDHKDRRSYTNGGIVNIISPAFQDDFIAFNGHLFSFNETAGCNSNQTRYYYNLFGTSLAGEGTFLSENRRLDKDSLVITDADQMMIWHLSQYMNDSIRRYLKPYFRGEAVPNKNTDVTIKGTIDLNKKGYYPTPVQDCKVIGEDSAAIIFYGDKLADVNGTIAEKGGEGEGKRGENYMLHSGLLISPEGGMTVQGDENYLTLKGKVTRLFEDSGALFVMSIRGTNTICRIRLEDLYLNNFGGNAHGYGLLIGTIGDGSDVNISWLETKGYRDDPARQTYAAAALIGRVGNGSANNLKLDFTNIKVGGKNPDRKPADKSEGIFRWAIFIDFHEYTDNTQENKGRVRYLFTEEAYKGKDMSETGNGKRDPFGQGIFGDNNYQSIGKYVTIGKELKDGFEYWNKDGKVKEDDIGTIDWDEYLPYVCTATHPSNKGIQVNPKNVSIDKGCGTYEDPYQITSAKQLLALSYYLMNGKSQQYLENWQIRKPGDIEKPTADGICTKSHTADTLKIYGQDDFPTQEELRKAYYMITDDIDFSALKASGDAPVAQSFVGLGTTEYPFSGVIVGKKSDGSIPKVILPYKRKGTTSNYFGLVQYAKGAVIKDLEIAGPEVPTDDNDLLTNVVRVSNSGSAVIGCILGGDNIIDNVKVETQIAVNPDTGGMNAAVGGYAGTVQQGSLILRNVSEDDLSGFRWGLLSGNDETMEPHPWSANYPFVSGAVGKVENGFVLYEGSGTSANDKILRHDAKEITGIYKHGVLPFSYTYDVITASGMEGEKNSIPVKSDGGNFTCDIADGAQLQLVSMAINSDSFSVYYDGGGYDKKAACRKAKYDKVGDVTTRTDEYVNATEKDDGVYWYPYIYRYFTFDGVSAEDSNASGITDRGFYQTLEDYGTGGRRSKLNAVTGDISASMTYRLKDDSAKEIDYDLSVYQRGFRGLGATYRVFGADDVTVDVSPRNGVYSDFRANFDGGGATIKAEMINNYAKGIHTAALFNDLVDTSAQNNYFIKNFTVTGTFQSSNSTEGNNVSNYAADRAAAVVGMMRRPWEISDITAKNVNVWSKGRAAGIVAWINLPADTRSDPSAKNYVFTNCKVLSVKEGSAEKRTVIYTLGGSSGGIVGTMATWHNNDLDGYSLTLDNCKVLGEQKSDGSAYYVYIENEGMQNGLNGDDQERNGRGRSGGMVGHVGKNHQGDINIKTRISCRIINSGSTGEDVQYVWISGSDSTGGVIGEYYGWRRDESDLCMEVANITVSDSVIESKGRNETAQGSFGVGGIIGKLQREATCEIKDTNVVNTDVRSVYGGIENSVSITNIAPKGDLNAGGVIGYCYYKSRVALARVQVRGAVKDGKPQYEISSRLSNAGGMIGACWDGQEDAEASKYVAIGDSAVSGMNILSDSRSLADREADKASCISAGAAGGVIGRASAIEALTVQDVSVENCVLRSGRGAAGGVIGNAVSRLGSLLQNINVESCKIGSNGGLSAVDAGGVFGRLGVTDNKGSQGLKGNLKIEQCDIYGNNAGGLVGNADEKQQIGNVWSDGTTGHKITVNENSVLGYYAGGIFGSDRSEETCFADVEISGNTIAGAGNGANSSAAGGFCGRKESLAGENSSHNLNDVTVENNRIFSTHMTDSKKQSAGGMFGNLVLEEDVYSYQAAVRDNAIGFCDVTDNRVVQQIFDAGLTGQMNAMEAAMGVMKGQTAKLWDGSAFVPLPSSLKEEEIGKYAAYYGNLAGTYSGNGHAYFLKPTVAYADKSATRPVVDVGNTESGTASNTMLSSPYAYRRNIHVIYFEPDGSGNNTAAGLWASTPMGEEGLFSKVNADAKLEEYMKVMSPATAKASELLDAYRLNIVNDSGSSVSDIYKKIYKDESGYLPKISIEENGVEVELPMIILDTQYGTADQLMGGVLAALTGAGGIHNSGTVHKDSIYDQGMNEIIGISVKPMKVENGAIQDGDAGRTGSIQYYNRENGHDRVEIFDNTREPDEEDADGKGTTFSMLTITYRQKDYAAIDGGSAAGGKIELQIPVFVVERLTIDTYLKMAEGEVYNADKAKAEGAARNPLLANDSSYTLYMEYIYGSARDKYSTKDKPICIDKALGITYTDEKGNIVPTKLWPGTRLTMIDVCDSNKVYYYTVREEDTVIKFEQFKTDPNDPASETYKNKPIHGENGLDVYKDGNGFPAEDRDEPYMDVGVERFLIIVDTALVDEELKLTTRNVRDYHITPELSDDVAKRTTLTEHNKLQVTMQPGLTIDFVSKGTEGITDISGIIQDGAEAEINATFQIAGEKAYWLRALNNQTTTIDSANHNKYLEVGIYFTDTNGNRVRLPDNTNVTVNGNRVQPWEEEIKEEENLGAYVNRTEVYFYKDGRIMFPLDKLKEIVQKDMDLHGTNNFSGITSEKLNILLNFANADLSAYTDNRYIVNLELLRIEDANYPAGGEIIDIYEKSLIARRQTDLACALETKDLMELGINTYHNQTPMPYNINFDFKLDFNGILSDTNHSMNQQIADKYYTVTYHIMEKTNQNGTPEYKPYTGSQLSLALAAPPSSDMQKGLQKGSSSAGEFANSVYITYKYNLREIEKGTGDAGRGVITRDLVLTVKDAAKMDLSNYKIVASVLVSDNPPGDIEMDVNSALSDFFVFTIAKLKTDLDY